MSSSRALLYNAPFSVVEKVEFHILVENLKRPRPAFANSVQHVPAGTRKMSAVGLNGNPGQPRLRKTPIPTKAQLPREFRSALILLNVPKKHNIWGRMHACALRGAHVPNDCICLGMTIAAPPFTLQIDCLGITIDTQLFITA
jgi:hypothetical protein